MLELRQKKGIGVAQYYFTQHSWTLDEYLSAFLLPDGKPSQLIKENICLFESEWNIGDDEEGVAMDAGQKIKIPSKKRDHNGRKKKSSVSEVITEKFAYAGGSARWMLQMTTYDIDGAIYQSLEKCGDMNDLLSFSLVLESPAAKAYLYYSSVSEHGGTLYSMVSQRATLLVADRHGTNGIKELYKRNVTLKNPAFLGWVVEADLLNRCKSGNIKWRRKGAADYVDMEVQKGVWEFDHDHQVALLDDGDFSMLSKEIKKLVPDKGEARTCKPMNWYQGGYDVVFIEVDHDNAKHVIVRFGQVTKSDSHSLKLKYLDHFLRCLAAAGYIINSVEMTFIVPLSKIDNFRLTQSNVESTGLLERHARYKAAPATDPSQRQKNRWTKGREHEQIHVYGLEMTSLGYLEGI